MRHTIFKYIIKISAMLALLLSPLVGSALDIANPITIGETGIRSGITQPEIVMDDIDESLFRVVDEYTDVADLVDGKQRMRIFASPRLLYTENEEKKVRPDGWNLFAEDEKMKMIDIARDARDKRAMVEQKRASFSAEELDGSGYRFVVPFPDSNDIAVKAGNMEINYGRTQVKPNEANFSQKQERFKTVSLYENVYPNIDVKFEDSKRSRSREIIIKKRPEALEKDDQIIFWEEYDLPKGAKVFDDTDMQLFGRQEIYEKTIFIQTPDSSVFSITSAQVYESGSPFPDLKKVRQIVDIDSDNNKMSIGLALDGSYLNSEDTVYPVVIDPDYVACFGGIYGYDERLACQLTDLSLSGLSGRFSNDFLRLGYVSNMYGNFAYIPLLKFNVDFQSLAAIGTLNNAALTLRYSGNDPEGTYGGIIYTVARKVNTSWSSSNVTFNNIRSSLSTVSASVPVTHFASPLDFSWNVTSAVQDWMNGGANNGLVVEETPVWSSGSWPNWKDVYFYFYDSSYGSDPNGVGSNEKSPYLQIDISSPSYPDLIIYSKSVDDTTIAPNQSITAYTTIKNNGSGSAASSYVGYYYSSNSTCSTGDNYLGNDSVSSLSAGSVSGQESQLITIPSNAAPGTGYICFIADKDGNVSESNENNNTAYIQITVADTIVHDVDITSLQFTNPNGYYRDGDLVSAQVTLKNNGIVSESVPYSFKIVDQTNSAVFTLTDTSSNPTVSAGESKIITLSGKVPYSTAMSTNYHQFKARLELYVSGDSDTDIMDSSNLVYAHRYLYSGGGGGGDPVNNDNDSQNEAEEQIEGLLDTVPDAAPTGVLAGVLNGKSGDDKGGDPINLRTGSFELTQTDISLQGRGEQLDFVRVYSSKSEKNARFGMGWSHSYNQYYFQDPVEKNVIIYKGGAIASVFETSDGGQTFIQPAGETEKLYWDSSVLVFEKMDGVKYRFSNQLTDNMGLLESIVDTNGNTVAFSYATIRGIDLLQTIADSSGRNITLAYGDVEGDLWDKIVSLTYNAGADGQTVIDYMYDTNLNLIEVKKAITAGVETNYEIDTFRPDVNNKMAEYEDPRGTILYNTYDEEGRTTIQYEHNPEIDSPGAKRLIYELNYLGEDPNVAGDSYCSLVKNYSSAISYTQDKFCFSSEHLKVFQSNKDGNSKIIARNADGMVTSITDELGSATTFEYDSERRKTKEILPDTAEWSTEISYSYGAFNRVSQKQVTVASLADPGADPVVKITMYSIDSNNGNILSIQDSLGRTESFTYDAYGNVLTHTDKNGNIITYTYDVLGNYVIKEEIIATLADSTTQTITKEYTYDQFGNRIGYKTPRGFDYSYTYDTDGNLLSQTNPLGDSKTYSYDAEGHLTDVYDELERRTEYVYDKDINASVIGEKKYSLDEQKIISTGRTYDQLGRIDSQADANGNTTNIVYDSAGRISKEIGVYKTTEHTYYANGSLQLEVEYATGESSANWQRKIEYFYDVRDNLIESRQYKTTNSYISTKNEYDGFGRMTKVYDQNNNAQQRFYDLNDNLIKIIDTKGNTTEFGYDNNGNKIWDKSPRCLADVNLCNPSGYSNSFEYDEVGRLKKQTNADNKQTIYFYNEEGQPTKITDRQNSDGSNNTHQTTFVYDNLGRKIQECDSYHDCNIFEYDKVGNMTSGVDKMNRRIEFTYDDFDRLIEEKDPANNITAYTYDDNGNKTSVTYPGTPAIQTQYDYDSANRLQKVTDTNNDYRQYSYDIFGNVLTERNKLSHTTSFTYDKLGRLISETNPQNTLTTYTYDNNGNRLTETIDGRITSFTYDELNRVTDMSHPGSKTESFTYDEDGNVATKTDGESQTIVYVYDKLDRPVEKQTNEDTVSYIYDNWDNLATLADETGSTQYAYDNENRLTSEQKTITDLGQVYIISRTYFADGQLDSLTDAGGNIITYNYDTRGFLDIVKKDSTTLADYAYTPMSLTQDITYGNGVNTVYTYDSLHRVSTIETTHGTSTFFKHDYTYDAESNRTGLIENNDRTVHYTYDNLGQLTGVDYDTINGSGDIAFTYDKWGNRLSMNSILGSISYFYNNANELTSYIENDRLTHSLLYDGNGSLTSEVLNRLGKDIRTVNYSWNSQNRLSSISYHDTSRPAFLPSLEDNTLAFQYDDFGNRVKKMKNNNPVATNYYINDGLAVLNELDNIGNVHKSLVYGLDQVAEIDDQGVITYVHTDALGSTVLLTDETGAVVAEYEYDVFGSIVGMSELAGQGTDYLFTNQEHDIESDLYYYNARYYNPSIGRFISRDSLFGRDGDTLSKNRYIYVKNNPLKYVDPTGRYGIDFHYYNVYYLARMAGLEHDVANSIATYSQYVDDDDKTNPWQPLNLGKVEAFHFYGSGKTDTTIKNPSEIRDMVQDALNQKDYIKAGMLLHVYADSWSHDSYSAYTGGHIYDGHDPDRPYKDVNKAMDASYSIYYLLSDAPIGNKMSKELNELYRVFSYEGNTSDDRAEYWKEFLNRKGMYSVYRNPGAIVTIYSEYGSTPMYYDYLDPELVSKFRGIANKYFNFYFNKYL
ncbi:MAG: DUF6765 family protein [Candidatus Magasanikbacteria bacterium]